MNTTNRFTINWGKGHRPWAFGLLLAGFLFVTAAGVPTFSANSGFIAAKDSALKIQPALMAVVSQYPDSTVKVIVQKIGKDAALEDAVAQLGGAVTADLHIINAFAAELKAKEVPALSQAKGVRWVSLDSPMLPSDGPDGAVDTDALKSVYVQTIEADKLWAEGYQGSGVTVALVDSGVYRAHPDLNFSSLLESKTLRVIASQSFAGDPSKLNLDYFGHGTHVAGVVGGDGTISRGQYIGVAPKVNLISVKVSDEQGGATASSVVNGLQWINDNADKYKIRVVNLSLNSRVASSYKVDPLDAAVEILWFNRITVVVSAGNQGKNALYAPANDPFVITVGATDDLGTASLADDVIAAFSGSGTIETGTTKPDLVAPGTNIVSLNSGAPAAISVLAKAHPSNLLGSNFYFRMSGTSMAAPVVSGAVALLLQSNPNLTPDQVKYRLMATAKKNLAGISGTKAGAGLLSAYAAVHGSSSQSANTGLNISNLLFTGTNKSWGSANWDSANWDSANWDSANWDSANWDSANWDSDYWGP